MIINREYGGGNDTIAIIDVGNIESRIFCALN